MRNVINPYIAEEPKKTSYSFRGFGRIQARKRAFDNEIDEKIRNEVIDEIKRNPEKPYRTIAKEHKLYPYLVQKIGSEYEFFKRSNAKAAQEDAVRQMFLNSRTGFRAGKKGGAFTADLADIVRETGVPKERVCEIVKAENAKLIEEAKQKVCDNIIDYYDSEKNEFGVQKFSSAMGLYGSLVEHVINENGILFDAMDITNVLKNEPALLGKMSKQDMSRIYFALKNPVFRDVSGNIKLGKISEGLQVGEDKIIAVLHAAQSAGQVLY